LDGQGAQGERHVFAVRSFGQFESAASMLCNSQWTMCAVNEVIEGAIVRKCFRNTQNPLKVIIFVIPDL